MADANNSPRHRSSYLLDGRRATIQDLVEADLLHIGSRLRFARPRKGVVHGAEVVEGGRIALDDGQVFLTPSKAATAATGLGAVDGWRSWVAESTGTTLDSLRSRLLDALAVAPGPAEDDESAGATLPPPPHEFLKDARSRADGEDPMEVTVQELLSHWGSRTRGLRTSQRVAVDLYNYGLTTVPDFRRVRLESKIVLVSAASEGDDLDKIAVPDAVSEAELVDTDERDIGLTLGNLPSAVGGVVSVTPQATFEQAITQMLLNDFSQLPVMANDREIRGAVTWKSIAQARHVDPDAPFSNAIVPSPAEPYDRELVDALVRLQSEDFVFVQDNERVISGIVTTADVVSLYGELATPFLLIGELDQELRQVISKRFSFDKVRDLFDADGGRGLSSFDDLTMGDYERILQNRACWASLGWPIDRVLFTERLAELREIRNDIMHFNPDSTQLDPVPKLRNVLKLLRKYGE